MDEALRLTGYASSFRDHAGQNVQWTLSRSLLRIGHLRIKHGAPSASRMISPENRVREIRTPDSESRRPDRPRSPTEVSVRESHVQQANFSANFVCVIFQA